MSPAKKTYKKDFYRKINIIISILHGLNRYTWQNTNLELVCKYIYIILYLCKQIIVSVDYMQSDILVCNNNKSHTFAEYDTLKYVNAFNCKFFHRFVSIYLSIFPLNHWCNSPLHYVLFCFVSYLYLWFLKLV